MKKLLENWQAFLTEEETTEWHDFDDQDPLDSAQSDLDTARRRIDRQAKRIGAQKEYNPEQQAWIRDNPQYNPETQAALRANSNPTDQQRMQSLAPLRSSYGSRGEYKDALKMYNQVNDIYNYNVAQRQAQQRVDNLDQRHRRGTVEMNWAQKDRATRAAHDAFNQPADSIRFAGNVGPTPDTQPPLVSTKNVGSATTPTPTPSVEQPAPPPTTPAEQPPPPSVDSAAYSQGTPATVQWDGQYGRNQYSYTPGVGGAAGTWGWRKNPDESWTTITVPSSIDNIKGTWRGDQPAPWLSTPTQVPPQPGVVPPVTPGVPSNAGPIQEHISRWNNFVKKDRLSESAIDLSSFKINDHLEPNVWTPSKKIEPEVRERLIMIAKQFWTGLDLPTVEIDDITFTGSLANFNWSQYSDVDLHILVDFKLLPGDEEITKAMMNSKRAAWNRRHNIEIHGYEVEIYVQDSNEVHHSTGVYSVLHDSWIVEPHKKTFTIDANGVRFKAAHIMKQIDKIEKEFEAGNFKEAMDDVDRLKEKIRKFRKCGLEQGGEYSSENIAFKVLRRNGYLQKLSELKADSYDRIMSL